MFLLLFILASSIYYLSLIFFLFGLKKIDLFSDKETTPVDISIIVCVRNGENSLKNILNDLSVQEYNGNLEFIIVNDESTDNSSKIIKEFSLNDKRFKYLNSINDNSNLRHKKRALNFGIKSSQYKWLLFTDVDCRVNKYWALRMAQNFKNNDYIIGFSSVIPKESIVSNFQSIDFNMLMFSSVSTTLLGSPFACSGQNQSYKKSLFESVEGFSKIQHLLQGDDSIFLQICRKKVKNNITFSTHPDSMVIAQTHNSWKKFILQRMRWAGDANLMWKYNKLFYIIILSTFSTNLFIIMLLIYLFINAKLLILTLSLLLIKFILEFGIYLFGNLKFKHAVRVKSFLIWFIIQIPYVVLMGILSFFTSELKWKERTNQ